MRARREEQRGGWSQFGIVHVERAERCDILDHDYLIFSEEKKWELIYHGLNRFLKMWTHHLKPHHVGELVGQQCGPPADGQILRVHAVGFAILRHPATNTATEEKSDTQVPKDLYRNFILDEMLKDELEHVEAGRRQFLGQ